MAGEQMDPVFQQVYADMTSLLDSSVTNGNAMEAKLNVFRSFFTLLSNGLVMLPSTSWTPCPSVRLPSAVPASG